MKREKIAGLGCVSILGGWASLSLAIHFERLAFIHISEFFCLSAVTCMVAVIFSEKGE